MNTNEINLLVYDTPENFEKTKNKLGLEGIAYKKIYNIHSTDEIREKISIKEKEPFFLVVHIFSESLDGVKEFNVSNITEEFPLLQYKFISNYGLVNDLCKRAIDEDLPLCKKDVFKYHGIKDYLNTNNLSLPLGEEILENSSSNKLGNLKNGIFLSHSSIDKDLVIKFRDLILITGLGCDLNNILLTSDEATATKEGGNIPNEIKDFLINKSGLFIQFISKNYIESRVCLNEEGAGWIKSKENMYISYILKGFKTKDLSWLKTVEKGSNINNRDSLLNLYNNRKSFFKTDVNITHYINQVNEFLNYLNNTTNQIKS